jgi:hypothetical protein
MDSFIPLLLLLVIGAIFVMPIVTIVRTNSLARSLREEMAGIMDRIRDLEHGLETLARRMTTLAERPREAAQAVHPATAPATAGISPAATKVEEQRPPEPAAIPDAWKTPTAPAPAQTVATLRPAAGAAFLPALPQAAPHPTRIPPTPAPMPPTPALALAPLAAAPLRPAPPMPNVPPAPLFEQHAGSAAEQHTREERALNLEERLGTNWLNKLGVVLLVLGVAFFLAWKLQTWGPAGKVLCGFAVSVTLLVGGVWLERKAMYRIFARRHRRRMGAHVFHHLCHASHSGGARAAIAGG